MKIGDFQWEAFKNYEERVISVARLMEQSRENLVASSAQRQEAGKLLLLDAAAQAEQLSQDLRQVVEELAKG